MVVEEYRCFFERNGLAPQHQGKVSGWLGIFGIVISTNQLSDLSGRSSGIEDKKNTAAERPRIDGRSAVDSRGSTAGQQSIAGSNSQ